MIVLDTNVVSELMRATPDLRVRAWLAGLGEEPLATSSVTIAEVTFGLSRLPEGRRRHGLSERFDALITGPPALPVLAIDERAGRLAGAFRAQRELLGMGSAPSDMLIAGVVLAAGASLATRNVGDFAGLPAPVLNPWAP